MDSILKAKEAMLTGQHPGLPNASIPLWERGNNVLFEGASIRPIPGQSLLFTPTDLSRVTGIQSLYYISSGQVLPRLIWGTQTKLFQGTTPPITEDVSRTVGGAYTGSVSDLWSIIQFGLAYFATNGKDEIQYKAPAGTDFVNISTVSDLLSTFRAKILTVLGPYILAFNTDNDPTEFRWCEEDDFTIWQPAVTNSARDIQIRDLLSDVVAVVDFAGGALVVGRDQAHFVRFVGPPFFFAGEHLIKNVAAVGKHSVLAFDRAAYGFASDGIWETDGASSLRISVPSIEKYVFEETYDDTRGQEVVVWSDASNVQVYFSYPTKDGFGTTVSFNRNSRVWTLHNYWRTAATEAGLWKYPIVADSFGSVFGQDPTKAGIAGAAANPMDLSDSFTLTTGYNELGYNESGYGGIQVAD